MVYIHDHVFTSMVSRLSTASLQRAILSRKIDTSLFLPCQHRQTKQDGKTAKYQTMTIDKHLATQKLAHYSTNSSWRTILTRGYTVCSLRIVPTVVEWGLEIQQFLPECLIFAVSSPPLRSPGWTACPRPLPPRSLGQPGQPFSCPVLPPAPSLFRKTLLDGSKIQQSTRQRA